MLYQTLLDNEVDEVYINQLLDDVMKVARKGSSMDFILSHVYQKMILKFGNPHVIKTKGKGPQIVFFIGPTGVGKTTTIAKIASKFKVEQGKKVAFLTADTYRISATEQLRTYANILDAPLTVIYAPEELPALKGLKVLRPGLHLGTLKKNRFEPSHALALALKPEQVWHTWELAADSQDARSYLSGQTFPAEGDKGWYLITVDGYSIGWGKLAGNMMKNHYPKGLRIV